MTFPAHLDATIVSVQDETDTYKIDFTREVYSMHEENGKVKHVWETRPYSVVCKRCKCEASDACKWTTNSDLTEAQLIVNWLQVRSHNANLVQLPTLVASRNKNEVRGAFCDEVVDVWHEFAYTITNDTIVCKTHVGQYQSGSTVSVDEFAPFDEEENDALHRLA